MRLGQDIDFAEEAKVSRLVKEVERATGSRRERKRNLLTDRPRPEVGNPLSDVSRAQGKRSRVQDAQDVAGTREHAMAQFDYRLDPSHARTYGINPTQERQDFNAWVDAQVKKHGKVPEGSLSAALELAAKRGAFKEDVEVSQAPLSPQRAIAGAGEAVQSALRVPSALVQSPSQGVADEVAEPGSPEHSAVAGVGGAVSMAAAGPLGGAAFVSDTVNAGIEGAKKEGPIGALKEIWDTVVPIAPVKDLFDPDADWGRKVSAVANLGLLVFGAAHGVKSGAEFVKGLSERLKETDPALASKVAETPPELYDEVLRRTEELRSAKAVRSDEGQVRDRGVADEGGKAKGGEDLQQPPQEEPLRQAEAVAPKGRRRAKTPPPIPERGSPEVRPPIEAPVVPRPEATQDFKRPNVLPRGSDTRLSQYHRGPVYRQTTLDSLMEGDYRRAGSWWSTAPELALGQQDNKGVSIEFQPSLPTRGTDYVRFNVDKPSSQLLWQEGKGEFQWTNQHSDMFGGIKSVTVESGAKVNSTNKLAFQTMTRDWAQETLPDGSVKYTNPKFNEKPVESTNEAILPPRERTGDDGQSATVRDTGRDLGGREQVAPDEPDSSVAVQDRGLDSTGLANQVQEREALSGIIAEVEGTKGENPRHWQEEGRKSVDDGYDFEALADRVGNGEEELTGLKTGILLEGKRQLLNDLEKAKGTSREDAAQERLDTYLDNVQAGKGRWSDVGRALQAGTRLDTANYAEVVQAAKSKKGASAKDAEQLGEMSRQIAAKDAEIERLQGIVDRGEEAAHQAVMSVPRARRYDRAQLKTRIDSNVKRLAELKGAKGVVGSKQSGAGAKITTKDLEIARDQALIVKDITLDWVRLNVGATLEDAIVGVQNIFAKEGVEIDRDAIVHALQLKRDASPRSPEAKATASVVSEARQPVRDQESVDRAKAALEETKGELRTGITVARKAPKPISEEVADIRAERSLLDARLRSRLRELDSSKGRRFAKGLANTVRGTILGSDLGVLTRQGLFSASRPKAYLAGLRQGARTVFSETELAKWADEQQTKRYSDGKLALRVRKDAGLSTTDALNFHEEMVLPRLLRKLPGRLGTVAGSLERFQTSFINTVRTEVFDAAYEKGLTPEELKTRARFINNSTGRGNIKNVPEELSLILTSPRYEASRWAMLNEPVRNTFQAIKNGDKGAVQNLRDTAVTAGAIFALYKSAELAGYTVNYSDPKKSDWLKLRKGNEVWDVSAGLVPRLRDIVGMIGALSDPSFTQNAGDVVKRSVVRTLSPALKTPVSELSKIWQSLHGSKKPVDPFTGFAPDEGDPQGAWAFAPLIAQSVYQSIQNGQNPAETLGVLLKEFVGQGVNFYPDRAANRSLRLPEPPRPPKAPTAP